MTGVSPAVNQANFAKFGRFLIEAVAVTYTIATASAGRGVRAGELIVRN